jgi:YegS/Rv2252/BmrU family lipid kinase
MRKVALIYNPVSGQLSPRRAAAIEQAQVLLRTAGIAVEAHQTTSPDSATKLARQAVEEGCDTVLACGGDGTVHAILQSLAGTDVALGVIPLGTANALAADLGLAGAPEKAVSALLEAVPVRFPVPRIHFTDMEGQSASRYFIVAAGIGADALLMSRMDARLKRKLGYLLYLLEAFRIWATHPFPLFKATYTSYDSETPTKVRLSQLLAVRVRSFGGVLHELAPGATLHNGKLRLLAFKTRSRLRYLRFLLAVVFKRHTFVDEIELWKTAAVHCKASKKTKETIFVEADGELLGTLPVRMEVAEEQLTLLVPRNAQP